MRTLIGLQGARVPVRVIRAHTHMPSTRSRCMERMHKHTRRTHTHRLHAEHTHKQNTSRTHARRTHACKTHTQYTCRTHVPRTHTRRIHAEHTHKQNTCRSAPTLPGEISFPSNKPVENVLPSAHGYDLDGLGVFAGEAQNAGKNKPF